MKQTDFILIAVSTLIAALAWVFFDAYHAYTTTKVAPALAEIAIPSTPKIDREVIEKLKLRRDLNYQVATP
jgi:hypothetical protein